MACLTVPVFADMRQKEAIALRDKNKPDSLFRYRPLDKEREFENIERQLVWLSQPLYVTCSIISRHCSIYCSER
jgi:hypothetical protein